MSRKTTLSSVGIASAAATAVLAIGGVGAIVLFSSDSDATSPTHPHPAAVTHISTAPQAQTAHLDNSQVGQLKPPPPPEP
ncbi:hypothetical protein, partial [Smaragdicoccus niigatensis]